MSRIEWSIALHGGAIFSTDRVHVERYSEHLAALREALAIGTQILERGGAALDVVEAVVVVLENDPLFNAGKGAAFTCLGTHELDASIMDGRTLGAGAVGAISTLKNPVLAARQVLEQTSHLLLVGPAADEFGRQAGLKQVTQGYYYSQEYFERLQEFLRRNSQPVLAEPNYSLEKDSSILQNNAKSQFLSEETGGTVGCVARDRSGNLAAATSTGGTTGKLPGRCGDSAIIGAGTYADNKSCAVSCTGKGEQFIRHSLAAGIAALVNAGNSSVDNAVQHALERMLNPGDGGVIAVDPQGLLSLRTNSAGMFWGAADSTGFLDAGVEPNNNVNQ